MVKQRKARPPKGITDMKTRESENVELKEVERSWDMEAWRPAFKLGLRSMHKPREIRVPRGLEKRKRTEDPGAFERRCAPGDL